MFDVYSGNRHISLFETVLELGTPRSTSISYGVSEESRVVTIDSPGKSRKQTRDRPIKYSNFIHNFVFHSFRLKYKHGMSDIWKVVHSLFFVVKS